MTESREIVRPRSARFLAALVLPSVLVLNLVALAPSARAGCNVTPEGRVLVMSNNVYEAERRDARKTGDMKNFVTRMKEMVPENYAPDIVLVQEVSRAAVSNIRRFMSNQFGCSYAVPANAARKPWDWIKKYWKLSGQDTAVIVNTDSMSIGPKGHISHSYKRSQAARNDTVKVKKTAWAQVTEKNQQNQNETPLTVLAASVHYPRGSDFRSESINRRLKKRFSVQIARFLENKKSDGTDHDAVIHVIAGDFNMKRFEGSPNNPLPPYKVLTESPWSYVDGPIALAPGGNPNPIDFLFSTGRPLRADMDRNNNPNPGSPGFYSNHDLRWSLVSAYPPP